MIIYAFIYLFYLQSKWGLLRPHDLVFLSKIEGIYAFNAPLCSKYGTKTIQNCPKYNALIIYIRNCDKKIKVKQNIFELVRVKRPL